MKFDVVRTLNALELSDVDLQAIYGGQGGITGSGNNSINVASFDPIVTTAQNVAQVVTSLTGNATGLQVANANPLGQISKSNKRARSEEKDFDCDW